MASSVEKWVGLGSAMAGLGLLWSRMPEHVHEEARHIISSLTPMVSAYFNPYEQITVSEYSEEPQFRRNKLFDAISAYLSCECVGDARKLRAELGNDSNGPLVGLDENQEVVHSFRGARMWWRLCSKASKNRGPTIISILPGDADEPRCYKLVFHKRHRKLVVEDYLPGIVERWRELTARNRQRRLFTNHSVCGKGVWSSVPYNPPATFGMLAMDPGKKREIMDDLTAFREGKEYHSKVGKAWKRGYLLHGPPGTGKSTMIAAMANFLDYDVFDLDLTSIKNNAELRKLFLDTTDKSIIVIEDIDAIEVDLATKRKGKKAANGDQNDGHHQLPIDLSDNSGDDKSKVTLSGLLSFVDGLWSACGGERIFVFTTNHVGRLDPALIRRGRMDKHIEMSYCHFEAFKVLASNYLGVADHPLFVEIGRLLDATQMTPADVAHNLMPRGKRKRNADECLAALVEKMKKAKMESASPPVDPVDEANEERFHSD
ncbi:AAA-ATPase At3g28580-like [Oryza brachyantha]|uniref:AAA-ATPase At3g28580-like n=1 Tax=Oryza brachyantha TaxID=4533 RepID=UPI001ADA9B76|nr:AAA-ATPase At3g28580-like [Oryza brachyantha]